MPDKKRINISIDAKLHTQLKLASVTANTTITQYVIDAITEKIAREKKKES